MPELYTIATPAVCATVQERVSKLYGYPREGVDGGRKCGKHDKMTGKGWTLQAFAVEVERDKDGEPVKDGKTFTRIVDPDTEGDANALSVAELSYLRTKWAEGQPRPVAAEVEEVIIDG